MRLLRSLLRSWRLGIGGCLYSSSLLLLFFLFGGLFDYCCPNEIGKDEGHLSMPSMHIIYFN